MPSLCPVDPAHRLPRFLHGMKRTECRAFRHLISDLCFLMKVREVACPPISLAISHSATHPRQVAIQMWGAFLKCLLCARRVILASAASCFTKTLMLTREVRVQAQLGGLSPHPFPKRRSGGPITWRTDSHTGPAPRRSDWGVWAGPEGCIFNELRGRHMGGPQIGPLPGPAV